MVASVGVARALGALACLTFALTRGVEGVEILAVRHEPAALDSRQEDAQVAIRLGVSEAARVSIHLYDGREIRVRTLEQEAPEGEITVTWDGRDHAGRRVPPEAYTYTIEAVTAQGERAEWDPTDHTGGEELAVRNAAWSREEGVVRYGLEKPGRVRLRVGLRDNGPLLRTVVDWVPRVAGARGEPWDGRDASGVLELADHPALHLVAQAFSLPVNTIVVLPEAPAVELIEALPDPIVRRIPKVSHRKRMYDFPQQSIETRRDFPIHLELPPGLKQRGDGVRVVREPVPIRVSVGPDELSRVVGEQFEAVFYVDGQFHFEVEVGFLPITWTWDPRSSRPGVHYLTANLRGWEGHFGMATVPVAFERDGGS